MTATLVITVGTSLFTSASWSRESPFGKIRGYRTWVNDLLEAPGSRRSCGGDTAERIEERLRLREAGDLDHVEWQPDRVLRYSAEVTTLLRWMQKNGERDLRAFIAGRYGRVDFVCPADPGDSARVAADHLEAVFRRRLGIEQARIADVIRSGAIAEKLDHFRAYLRAFPAGAEVDLVVSGGYKVFAMFAAVSAASPERRGRWRVIYVHEDSKQELIVQQEREDRLVFGFEPGNDIPAEADPTPIRFS